MIFFEIDKNKASTRFDKFKNNWGIPIGGWEESYIRLYIVLYCTVSYILNPLMNGWEYDHFILYELLLCRQVLLVDNSLVLNHIILRRITVLKNRTFGTQRYTIVNHDSNESYEIYYHNSIYKNNNSNNNIFFSIIHD